MAAGIFNRKRRSNIGFLGLNTIGQRERASEIPGGKTHSSKGVGDSQPDGGDERRRVAEGQETKDGQSEDGAGQGKDAPKSDVILNQTGHQSRHLY